MARKLASLLAIALLAGFNVGLAQNDAPSLEPNPDNPNTRVGTRGANFLLVGSGGRQLGMAGAGATLMEGVFAMYWNPAAIAGGDEGFSAAFSYRALYADADVDHFFAGLTIPFLGGVIGADWANLSSGDIERTTEAFPQGGDPIFGSTFSWTSTFIGGYYARGITDRLQVGAGLKFVTEGIDDAKAEWIAFDAGVTFRTGLWGVELGATAQNIGGSAKFSGAAVDRVIDNTTQLFAPNNRDLETSFDTRGQELPTLFRFTAQLDIMGSPEALVTTPSSQYHMLNFAVDFWDAVNTDLQTVLGLEYAYRQIAFARIGKHFFNEDQRTGDIGAGASGTDAAFFRQSDFRDFSDGLSFGGGLRVPVLGRGIAFDYAYTSFGELDNVQTFSFEFGF